MNGVVAFALRQRAAMVVLFLALIAGGIVCFARLNIEAYPDPVPPLVDIVTQSSGQSAEEIERYITIPIEVALSGIPHVTTVRTISLFGLSDVKIQFTYDFTYEEAEQRVINRLAQLPQLPGGAQPQISPTSPIGEIYRYRLVGPPGYSLIDLKTIQDWILQRRFRAVPGVIDVTGWGGKSKAYEVTLDLARLTSYGVTVPQVLQAINNGNGNVGGQTVQFGTQSAVVRGIGLIESMDEIRGTMVTATNGVAIRVGDLAEVRVGNLPRLGIAGQDADDDIVQGIVLMRRGAESLPTIKGVQAEIEKINGSGLLPPGVHIERIYDRSELIGVTTHTVLHNMVVGVVLIFCVQWAFLGNLRSALIVAATIPFALFFAITILFLRGESANLLSVGAIDFGLIVDATVIMVENIYRNLSHAPARGDFAGRAPRRSTKLATIADGASEVNRAIFFSAAIIIAGFVPLFTMSGVEGHIFGPMARTYAYAISGGLIATFTVSPALAALLLPTRTEERDTPLVRAIRRVYRPALRFALANRVLSLGGGALLFAAALIAGSQLGLEFLPKLEEGNFWIRATMPNTVSLETAHTYVDQIRKIIKSYPEVVTVVSQNGRPDDGTDATGFFNAEFYVPLKPFDRWPAGVDKERLTAQINDALSDRFPGIELNFSQAIADNVEEAASGVKGENSIKLFGNDLQQLETTANKIAAVLSGVSGVTDVAVLRSLGQPTVKITVDRLKAGRYGLAVSDVNQTIQAAIGGQAAGNLYEPGSDRNFPILVRLDPQNRTSLEAMRSIPVGAPATSGSTTPIPLSEVATVELVSGASFVYREQQERYIPIKFSVRGRDLGGAVLEAQQRVAEQVEIPAGYRLDWVGEFGELQEAIGRLAIVVPISLALIGLLLYVNFGSLGEALLAASVLPMALVGGIVALYATGTPFSVSAAIGFVALFGIAAMDGIIVVAGYRAQLARGRARRAAVLRTGETQLRPVMMTCIAACVGLLPAAVSTGIGAQVQRPLALVVVGGIVVAPFLILIVLPVLIDTFSRRQPSMRVAEEDAS